jgi:hypothetical protein
MLVKRQGIRRANGRQHLSQVCERLLHAAALLAFGKLDSGLKFLMNRSQFVPRTHGLPAFLRLLHAKISFNAAIVRTTLNSRWSIR